MFVQFANSNDNPSMFLSCFVYSDGIMSTESFLFVFFEVMHSKLAIFSPKTPFHLTKVLIITSEFIEGCCIISVLPNNFKFSSCKLASLISDLANKLSLL